MLGDVQRYALCGGQNASYHKKMTILLLWLLRIACVSGKIAAWKTRFETKETKVLKFSNESENETKNEAKNDVFFVYVASLVASNISRYLHIMKEPTGHEIQGTWLQ